MIIIKLKGLPKAEYPDNLLENLKTNARTISFNAFDEAKAIGDPRTMNILLLGAAIKKIGLADLAWETVIAQEVRKQFYDINLKAFKRGQELAGTL